MDKRLLLSGYREPGAKFPKQVLVIRKKQPFVRITGNGVCAENGSPVNGNPVNGNGVYCDKKIRYIFIAELCAKISNVSV